MRIQGNYYIDSEGLWYCYESSKNFSKAEFISNTIKNDCRKIYNPIGTVKELLDIQTIGFKYRIKRSECD